MQILIDRVDEKSGGRIALWIYISLLFDTIITERIYHYLEGKIEVQITSHASLFELYISFKFDLIYNNKSNNNNITEKERSILRYTSSFLRGKNTGENKLITKLE